ncbi:hypothetical protein TorRG33x02_213230 [Trema orientale]|uniref:Peptidase M n=1 Tax=Trema orientale TaxID=63057 RepID=A0A2P5EBI8_TREOI|nr:hypothetical protein TorRG33x02_213230 [Trema orientale]
MGFFFFCMLLTTLLSQHVADNFVEPTLGCHGSDLELLTRELLDSAREPKFFEWMQRVKRKIHQYPELGFEKERASQLIWSELDSLGVEYTWPVATTGAVASVGLGSGPVFALRAS